jgi:hypothetical protein
MDKVEIILGIAAEGGSITLYGQKDYKGNWIFCRGVADHTPTFLSDDNGKGENISHSSAHVKTWEEAIALLDKYPWAMLSGIEVHSEFRDRIWSAVLKRLEDKNGERIKRTKARWAVLCGLDLDVP